MVKRVAMVVVALGIWGVAVAGPEHEHGKDKETAGKKLTVQGEVLDLACYMGHEAKGDKHKSCAAKCIQGGAPIGILTASGEVYLVVEDHAAKKPYETLKDKAAMQVQVSGTLYERGGLPAIVVASVEDAK